MGEARQDVLFERAPDVLVGHISASCGIDLVEVGVDAGHRVVRFLAGEVTIVVAVGVGEAFRKFGRERLPGLIGRRLERGYGLRGDAMAADAIRTTRRCDMKK